MGNKKKSVERMNIDFWFYEFFFYDGEEYSLQDSIVLFCDDDLETYVGKLVRMYEMSEKEKRVKQCGIFVQMRYATFFFLKKELTFEH